MPIRRQSGQNSYRKTHSLRRIAQKVIIQVVNQPYTKKAARSGLRKGEISSTVKYFDSSDNQIKYTKCTTRKTSELRSYLKSENFRCAPKDFGRTRSGLTVVDSFHGISMIDEVLLNQKVDPSGSWGPASPDAIASLKNKIKTTGATSRDMIRGSLIMKPFGFTQSIIGRSLRACLRDPKNLKFLRSSPLLASNFQFLAEFLHSGDAQRVLKPVGCST